MSQRPAERLLQLLHGSRMIDAVAAYDGLTARIAEQVGFEAIIVGGGLTSNFVFGLPDIGIVSTAEIIGAADRVAGATSLPVIVDVDDGGHSPAQVRRTIELAARSQVAGVMVEDTDSTMSKHLWSDDAGGWDFADDRLYPIDVAIDRLLIALEARPSAADLLVLARTDMWHQTGPDAHAEAFARVRAYADLGADFVFVPGMPGAELNEGVVASIGAPLLHAEDAGVSGAERARLATAGVRMLFHWLMPFLAVFDGYRSALQALRDDVVAPTDRSPTEINNELLRAVDLPGWSQFTERRATSSD